MPFLRQWSQVGHSRARLSRKEMEQWAMSLDHLMASRGERSVIYYFYKLLESTASRSKGSSTKCLMRSELLFVLDKSVC